MMSVFFVTHQMHLQATIFKRLLLRHLRRMHGSAALYRFTISNSACFSISDPAQVLLLRSTFGLFPHHFVEHFRGRCAQDVAFGKQLKLLAGLVLIFSLLENSSIHRNQVPIHFGLLCDMREELSDTKWQDCDPQSWSLWYDANVMACPEYLSRFCQVGVCPISTSRGMQFSAATIAWCPGRCRCRFFVSFRFKQRAIGLSHFSYFFF